MDVALKAAIIIGVATIVAAYISSNESSNGYAISSSHIVNNQNIATSEINVGNSFGSSISINNSTSNNVNNSNIVINGNSIAVSGNNNSVSLD